MKVTRFPSNPGPSAWRKILPPAPARPALEGEQTADWLVVGAGFAGLSSALRLSLARPDDRIALLDACRVAEGPAGRNSGFMIDLPHDLTSVDYGGDTEADRAAIARNRAAISFAREASELFDMPNEAFRSVGKINAAATEAGMAHNQAYAAHLDRLGEASSHLDSAQMRALTGSRYYQGGLFTPGTVMLQPAAYVQALATGLAARGVLLYEQSPVRALDQAGPDWVARTDGGRITAPRVILATNGHVESFGFFRGRLLHVYTFASMTRAMTDAEITALGGEPDWGLTPADPMGSTLRRVSGQGGHRLLVRNRFAVHQAMRVPERKLARIWHRHDQSFAARFPTLGAIEMAYRWGGQLCLSLNNTAAFGEVAPNLFSANCQNGLGTVQGTFNGMMAADLALGRASELLSQHAARARPSRLPPSAIAQVGANLRIGFDEWRAGAEL